MSLRFGRLTVASPGPSIIPDQVLAAMARPMPNMYEGEIIDISLSVLAELPSIARTSGEAFLCIGNGHAAWQMAVDNTMARGDRVLVLESGRFATAWGELAAHSGVGIEVLPGSFRRAVDPLALKERLAADRDHELTSVLMVQTDTASSVRNDVRAVREALDETGHPALLQVDCIASLGCEPYEMDAWGVDLTVAACQKGLMVPPGVSFVWAGPRALAAYDRSDLHSGYFDWSERRDPDLHYKLYAGTLPISHLYGLRTALDLIGAEGGLDAVWRRHQVLADAVRAAVEAWSTPGGIELNVLDPDHRSNAVTTVLTGSVDATELARLCEHQAGLVLGVSLGEGAGRSFRIGHMGHLNPPSLLGTLGTIEAALLTMGAPLGGSGIAAATGVIAAAMTRS